MLKICQPKYILPFLWKHVGSSEDGTIVWPIRQWKTDGIRAEVFNLEILYQLLEQSEDLYHQRWSSSHDQTTEILWFSTYGSIVHDVLVKNVSTNLDNITRPFSFLNVQQTAGNQGFFESRQMVSIFPWTLILYCIAKVCNRFSKWGNDFIPLLYRILSV